MIYIKDMKIPQNCDTCRFYSYSDNGDYCSASEHCLDITNLVDTRHKDCPLAEIDVIEEFKKIKIKFKQYRDKWNYYGNEYEMTKYETYDICIDEIDERISELEGNKR